MNLVVRLRRPRSRFARLKRVPLSTDLAHCEDGPEGCIVDLTRLCETAVGPCERTRIEVARGAIEKVRRQRGVFTVRCEGLDPFVYPGFR